MKIWFRLRTLFRRGKAEAEMSDEIRLHLELQTERNLAAGMDPNEARYAAQRAFGGVEQVKERCREQREWVWLELTWQDLRYGGRQLKRTPGFTLTAIFILALGIGACGAMFTVVNSVLLRPIPLPESDRLVVIQETHPRYPLVAVSPASFRAWEKQADLFESMAVRSGYTTDLVGHGEPVRVNVAGVTEQYFELLRAQPAIGRAFTAAENEPGKEDVVVLMHAFWQRQFGGRPDVVGSSLRLGDQSVIVVGVMPEGFTSGDDEVITPIAIPEEMWTTPGRFFSWVIGRLKPGVTLAQARAQMDAIARQRAETLPKWNQDWTVRLTAMLDFETQAVRPIFYALLAAVGVLLTIVCATLANLVLVRATVRQRELSVRIALGAGRGRVVRQLLTESLLLAVIGGTLGLVVAKAGIDALLALAPFEVPRASEVSVDPVAVWFTFALTLLTSVGFGLVPAWSGTRMDALRENPWSGGGRRASGLRQTFVVAQIALSVVLLIGAGLLVRSFARLTMASPGFEPRDVLVLEVQNRHRTAETQRAFAETMVERIGALPGVRAVGATYKVPFSGGHSPRLLDIEGRDVPFNARPGVIHFQVTPDYFRTMGIPLLRGRWFGPADRLETLPVAIISQSLADRFFPSVNAIGQRIRWDGRETQAWREIVGVVGDVRHESYDKDIVPQIYEPFAQVPSALVSFAVRTNTEPSALARMLRRELHAVEPEVPVTRLERLERLVATSFAAQRFAATLFAVFSGAALLLAAGGIYGVTAFVVAQRTREFGLRLALGAQERDLRRMVLAWAARFVVFGTVVGGVGALLATRFIRALLFQVRANDPTVFATQIALLAVVALLACYLPARKAAKVDPMVALRCE